MDARLYYTLNGFSRIEKTTSSSQIIICLVVDNEKELAELVQNKKIDTTKIKDYARKILKNHAKVDWQKEIVELQNK